MRACPKSALRACLKQAVRACPKSVLRACPKSALRACPKSAFREMLAELHQQPSPPAELFLQAVFASAELQMRADQEHHVPWNRHFLACLRRTMETPLLAVAKAVNTNPHYQQFSSPDPPEVSLESEQSWPPLPVLLLLDSTNQLIARELRPDT
jgi:hypothetical protein